MQLRIVAGIWLTLFGLQDLYAQQKPAFVVQATPARKIEATLTYEIRYANAEVKKWELIQAKPRDLPCQFVTKVAAEPPGKEFTDEGTIKQPLFYSLVVVETDAQKSAITTVLRIEATLLMRRLVPAASVPKRPPVATLSDEERKTFLAPTEHINHTDETFQQWLEKTNLRRKKKESEIDFAKRAFLTMKTIFTYQRPYLHDGKASSTCQAAQGDCSCLATVFVAALRANDIPARRLLGRLVKSDKPFDKSNDGHHCRAEFHLKGVGWVPVDPTYSLNDKSPQGLAYFGYDAGDFLVFHWDGDLLVDTKLAGKQLIKGLQGPSWWVRTVRTPDKPELKENWQIRDLPLDPKKK